MDGGTLHVDGTTNRVGVGIDGPSANLDVTGSSLNSDSLRLRSGDVNTGTDSNQILLSFSGQTTFTHAIKSRHNAFGDSGNAIDFYLWDSGTDTAETIGIKQVMTLDGTGNVGIGTSIPSARLDVVGTTELNGNVDVNGDLDVDGIIQSDGNPFIHTSGTDSFFAGVGAGNLTTTGSGKNTGVGGFALNRISTGSDNTASGRSALFFNDTGNRNTAVGSVALSGISGGSDNTAIGFAANVTNPSLNNITAIGASARVSSSNGTAIGANAEVISSDATAIGFGAKAQFAASNKIRLGNDAVTVVESAGSFHSTGGAFIAGSGFATGTTYGDGRIDFPGSPTLQVGGDMRVAGSLVIDDVLVARDLQSTSTLVANGNVTISGANTLEFGRFVPFKETNAGKIGYETFTTGALDIVGAGTTGTNRKIQFFNEGGASFNGPVNITGIVKITGITTVPFFADNGVGVQNDGEIVRTGSSLRYKDNIQPFDDNFDLMLQTELKSWTDLDGNGFGYGYIAEELDALGLTNLVIYDDQGRPESLMFGAIPFYILEIVKNHNARLAEKDAEMGSLQSQVTDLEARVTALEQAAGVSGA